VIVLTGGSGLLGRHILVTLRAAGLPVLAIARSPATARVLQELGAETLSGRVEDQALWARVSTCEAVIHSAAIIYTVDGWDVYRQINVEGTRLAAAHALSLGVPLIHISSVAVYAGGAGAAPPGTVTEAWPIGSLTGGALYPRSKRQAEQAVWEARDRGLKAIVLRPCVVYGEGDRLFLPYLLRVVRRGWFPLVGHGHRPLALVYTGNVAQAVVAALEARGGWGQAYNVTNDDAITAREFALALGEGLGRSVRTVRLPEPAVWAAAGVVDLYRGLTGSPLPGFTAAARFLRGGNPYSSRAAREILGWAPTVRHREAVPRAVRAVRGELER
jgi:nucleoside-diphosphate-sugar epimerase